MAYLHEDRNQFLEAINLTVFKTGMEPEVIEKDYYMKGNVKRHSRHIYDILN